MLVCNYKIIFKEYFAFLVKTLCIYILYYIYILALLYTVQPIEIINNTREGIVMFIQAKKGNASNGGQKIQMLK